MHTLLLLLIALTTATAQTQDASESNDYLTRITMQISEQKIPHYLTNVIYERPLEKNITTPDVINLFSLDQVPLNTTENILQLINIAHSQVFSLNAFDYTLRIFNWTFTNFYNSLTTRMSLSGIPLRNALTALNIDVNEFSAGITWGVPDPWQEFIKGNFTRETLQNATGQAELTLEDLWAGVRGIFIDDLITFEIRDFVNLASNHYVGEEQGLVIWNALPVTLEHVYSLELFSDILGNFSDKIQNQTVLGVLIDAQQLVIHRDIYNVIQGDRELLDITAQTLVRGTTLNITEIDDGLYRNLVTLRPEHVFDNLTVIRVAGANANLTNCTYVTFLNNNILSVGVPAAELSDDDTYLLPGDLVANVVSGSALVCDNTVYGLARGVENDEIVVDAFAAVRSGVSRSGGSLVLLVLFYMVL